MLSDIEIDMKFKYTSIQKGTAKKILSRFLKPKTVEIEI